MIAIKSKTGILFLPHIFSISPANIQIAINKHWTPIEELNFTVHLETGEKITITYKVNKISIDTIKPCLSYSFICHTKLYLYFLLIMTTICSQIFTEFRCIVPSLYSSAIDNDFRQLRVQKSFTAIRAGI